MGIKEFLESGRYYVGVLLLDFGGFYWWRNCKRIGGIIRFCCFAQAALNHVLIVYTAYRLDLQYNPTTDRQPDTFLIGLL